MRHTIRTSCYFLLALLVAVLTSSRLQIQAAPPDKADNAEVTKLLEDIELQSADLQRDADTLESYTHSDVSWESHADELNHMREDINRIGQTIQRLQGLRGSASSWQQEAIDRIIPVAQRLASNTQAAIEHLDQFTKRLQDPQYQQYLESNAEAAAQLTSMVREFVEYGKTQGTLEALERRLELQR
jgi:hypothetical protein